MRILFTESLLSEDTDIVKLIQFDALLYPSDFVNIFVSAFVDHQQQELIKKEQPIYRGREEGTKQEQIQPDNLVIHYNKWNRISSLKDEMILYWHSVFPPHPKQISLLCPFSQNVNISNRKLSVTLFLSTGIVTLYHE